MNNLDYEEYPSSTKNPHNRTQYVIKGLSETGVYNYLTNKESTAYNFLPKPTYEKIIKNDNKGSNGFFSTAIDYKSNKDSYSKSGQDAENNTKSVHESIQNNRINGSNKSNNGSLTKNSFGFNKLKTISKLPSIRENRSKRKFDPLLTKQKLFLQSRSYSVANMVNESIALKTCKPVNVVFPYQTRHDTEKYNKTLFNIKNNLNMFSNNRSCENIKLKKYGSFDLHNVPRIHNRSNSIAKLNDSQITKNHYEKIMNSVGVGKSHKVNRTEIKFDLKSYCEKEKEKTHRVIFNNTNSNYLAKYKMPKLSTITMLPKLTLTKSPSQSKTLGERFNPFVHEPFRRNMQVRNYFGGLYPY